MVRETRIAPSSLIYPLFVVEGEGIKEEILSMEGQYRYSADRLEEALEEVVKAGVNGILLFGVPKTKDEEGRGAYDDEGVVQQGLRKVKKIFPNLYVVTDVCMCEYTSHGHCGILKGNYVDNDATLKKLSKIALSHVRAGADMVAPSDMMDGRVKGIRRELDRFGYTETPILSYGAKYASSFYKPFREAANSTPLFGDRKTYQMDYHNRKEGIRECMLDVEEGADIIMVKPALAYLDVIREVSERIPVPVAAYSVSGEYAMVKAGAKAGCLDEGELICEMAVSAYRAGADIYISYFAKELAAYMREGRIG